MQNLVRRFFHNAYYYKKRENISRNEAELEQVIGQEFHPGVPVIPARSIKHDHRNDPGFAGLHQGEDFKGFIHCSETTREKREGMRFLHKVQLTIEEIVEIDQLRIA